ncbi:autotransporter domain-containing protein [Pseudomonas guariconensis]|uniref:esterase EstP n=1 Tax=Pseudomonas TaxID=286 RepID=UPI00209753E1|nr:MULTISPECIES: esterase EstP [Pseudomonas]MCO7638307.1 autotransporter domain-containing protein [Pseudomonas sp. S 311-6]MCO7514116.1 autotransporter domain-containing protein [Pseudomonas putida]MCO7564369.1 autotransporter domain-containing protein [Pseudomonas mosselii]MCO7605169.1 autotransporter domain-containing protein [Pseudomonas guariconensis]MCO7615691.1 autotransporter domain-containing protein [Pseudomonas guariconensis]
MRKPPFLRSLLGLLALACSQAMAAPSPYSTLIVFGDSLSDAGQFPDLAGGTAAMRFTNRDTDGNYAPVSPMLLGGRLGVAPADLNPSTSLAVRPDGNNWAVGGYTTQQILDSITDTSRTVIPPGNPGAGAVLRERPGYLASGLGADPNALYYLTGGGNDFLQGLVNSPADAAAAGARLAASAQALQQGGARYIMVWLLPDLGQTPNFSGTPQQGPLSQLSGVFNQSLVEQLDRVDAEIIPLNIPVLLQEALASPAQFGLAADQDLVGTCYSGGSCVENPVYGINGPTPDPSRLLFNDSVHPTIAGQRLIADYAYSIIAAPWELTLLPEMAHASLRAHQDELRNQWQTPWQAVGHWQAILATGAQDLDFDDQRSAASGDGRGYNLTLGGSYRLDEAWRIGLAAGVYRQKLEAGEQDSDYKLDSYLATLFAQFRQQRWWADAALTAGHLDYHDLERTFALGVGERSEKGDTDGETWALSGRLGYNLATEGSDWQLSPFVSADYARVKVDGYDEKSGRSTALGFDDQDRTSRRLGVGLQGSYLFAPGTRLFAEVAREHEFEDDRQDLTMRLATLPANDFTLTGYTPHSNLTRASLGLTHELTPGLHVRGNYNWRKSDELTQQGVSLALSLDF